MAEKININTELNRGIFEILRDHCRHYERCFEMEVYGIDDECDIENCPEIEDIIEKIELLKIKLGV